MNWTDHEQQVETTTTAKTIKAAIKRDAKPKPASAATTKPAAIPTGKKLSLPQVLEQDVFDKDESGAIIRLLEEGVALKAQIGVKPDEKKNVEGSGLLKRDHDIRAALGEYAASNGLDGLRHNRIVYTQRLQEGRRTLNAPKLAELLLAAGVKAEVVMASIEQATIPGDSFWVREIGLLK